MNLWKLLPASVAVAAAAAAADYGIAGYFFGRTMIRQNASTERTMDMAGTNWEQYMPRIEKWKAWLKSQEHEEVHITSGDGLKLHGTYFPGEKKNRLVICCHGYTGSGMRDFIGLSDYYLTRGYSMLLVDLRAHGESEGTYVGFGCLDRLDVLKWLDYSTNRFGEEIQIWLHGISMGGATVLMTAGKNLPASVRGVISDCAFTCAWDVFSHVLKDQYHLPAYPILLAADSMVWKRAGYGLRQCNAVNEVARATVPVLFIHGGADTFVPRRMCDEIYQACASEKERLIVPGAGHAESYYCDTEAYQQKLSLFLEKTQQSGV